MTLGPANLEILPGPTSNVYQMCTWCSKLLADYPNAGQLVASRKFLTDLDVASESRAVKAQIPSMPAYLPDLRQNDKTCMKDTHV